MTQKFESAWSQSVRDRVQATSPDAVVVCDLGVRARPVLDAVPTCFIDHHYLSDAPPLLTGHADYNNPFEFVTMMRQLEELEFDVMLEAKAKDLALLRLRSNLARIAPDVAARFGISATDVTPPQAEEIALQTENSGSLLDMSRRCSQPTPSGQRTRED